MCSLLAEAVWLQPSWELPKWPLVVMVNTRLLKKHQTFEETLHILVSFGWYQLGGLVVSSMPQIAGSPQLCYGKTVHCFFCTSTWHVATSLPSVISLSDSNWTHLCVADKLCPGISCGLRRHSVLHASVTSLRDWSPSPRPHCSVGLLFVTSYLFPPCCQQISRTHFLKSNSGLELAPIHCVGLVSLHTATYTCPKIFSNSAKTCGRAKYINAIRVSIRLTELSELSQALYRPLSLRKLHSPLTWMLYLDFLGIHLQKQYDYEIQISSSGLFFTEGLFSLPRTFLIPMNW